MSHKPFRSGLTLTAAVLALAALTAGCEDRCERWNTGEVVQTARQTPDGVEIIAEAPPPGCMVRVSELPTDQSTATRTGDPQHPAGDADKQSSQDRPRATL